ncbi:unnamed protein product [Mycena citricolor]|uniref:Uncharacterized protein n=1 Tax=Mycena citricolor TaxID=2018698 RepID=A0AAD2GUP9_9AGAR|nr:unnamed protein product [Mycena citricolor]CAK5275835.1 unnamed protein product [Mycena citricolor]
MRPARHIGDLSAVTPRRCGKMAEFPGRDSNMRLTYDLRVGGHMFGFPVASKYILRSTYDLEITARRGPEMRSARATNDWLAFFARILAPSQSDRRGSRGFELRDRNVKWRPMCEAKDRGRGDFLLDAFNLRVISCAFTLHSFALASIQSNGAFNGETETTVASSRNRLRAQTQM